ncbi:hypothetical protein HELRODRAFT_172613 [Helobdella robusta]|uniref:Ig-like domain-containing protein n=1 Tax=Helobdella robusta TaxID=6412 RepID=T1F5M6_HELRO|nr:hypothetical protein HELRODRAFT_172613 [Helobdella robusta]ESO04257.1 hypothetical protein HELRODRAFT_172613 [Helobdella robusta]
MAVIEVSIFTMTLVLDIMFFKTGYAAIGWNDKIENHHSISVNEVGVTTTLWFSEECLHVSFNGRSLCNASLPCPRADSRVRASKNSVKIFNLTTNDSGLYECYIAHLRVSQKIYLTVIEKLVVNASRDFVTRNSTLCGEEDESLTYTCRTDYYVHRHLTTDCNLTWVYLDNKYQKHDVAADSPAIPDLIESYPHQKRVSSEIKVSPNFTNDYDFYCGLQCFYKERVTGGILKKFQNVRRVDCSSKTATKMVEVSVGGSVLQGFEEECQSLVHRSKNVIQNKLENKKFLKISAATVEDAGTYWCLSPSQKLHTIQLSVTC